MCKGTCGDNICWLCVLFLYCYLNFSLTSSLCGFRMLSSQRDITKEAMGSLCCSCREQPTLNLLLSPFFLIATSHKSASIYARFWVTGTLHTLPSQGDPCLGVAFPSACGFLFLKDSCTQSLHQRWKQADHHISSVNATYRTWWSIMNSPWDDA